MFKYIGQHFWWTLTAELLLLTPLLMVIGVALAALLFGKGEPAQSGLIYGAIAGALVMVATIWLCADFVWYWRVLLSLAAIVLGIGGGIALLMFAIYRIVGAMKVG